MKKILSIITMIACLFIMEACSKNQITGRNQLALLPESQLQEMARQEYRQFLNENRAISPSADGQARMVQRVANNISNAVTRYFASRNQREVLSGFKWEYNLVAGNEVNAFCMPGGKIVVYTGLLPVTQTEAGLAVVLGHEIAHALARHGNERMSQAMLAQGIGITGDILTKNNRQVNDIFSQVYGPASQVAVLLPHSRKQELEADRYGLMFMAMAGYNPQESIALWHRMQAAGSENRPPEFLSTHPSESTRIAQLNKHMKEAMKYYRSA